MKTMLIGCFILRLSCSSADICVNRVSKCVYRYELRFDFERDFRKSCSDVYGSCVCLNHFDTVFFAMPPYVIADNRTGRSIGLLPGESRKSKKSLAVKKVHVVSIKTLTESIFLLLFQIAIWSLKQFPGWKG